MYVRLTVPARDDRPGLLFKLPDGELFNIPLDERPAHLVNSLHELAAVVTERSTAVAGTAGAGRGLFRCRRRPRPVCSRRSHNCTRGRARRDRHDRPKEGIMRTRRRFGVAIPGLTALAVLLGGRDRAGAAPIIWGQPTTISRDADVVTTGTLVGALNLGLPTTNTTVNGVPFTGLSLTFAQSSGPFSFSVTGVGFFGESSAASPNPPFSTLSPPYQALLGAGGGSMGFPTAPPFLLTITGLTAGDKYEFEWWTNLSSIGTQLQVKAAAVNSVVLSSNTTGTDGGVGQFVTGTFTADAASEGITFSGVSGSPVLNGLQLRDLGPATPIPEPSSLALFALGGLGLAGWRRWRGRARASAGSARRTFTGE
jgi:hypothetical protein